MRRAAGRSSSRRFLLLTACSTSFLSFLIRATFSELINYRLIAGHVRKAKVPSMVKEH